MFNQCQIGFNWLSQFLHRLHSNLYLIISCYGMLLVVGLVLSIHWFFHAQLDPIYTHALPPAWWKEGDINHILGTTPSGQDIFDLLLIGYRATLFMTLKVLIYVVILAAIINYLLFFIATLRPILLLILRLFSTIPPLLGIIVISLLFKNSTTNMLIVIGFTYMPRFIYNIHMRIIQESHKTYITAYRLDGLSMFQILTRSIIPNISLFYLSEFVTLFSQIILVVTTLTFLGFANNQLHPDLGMMMFQMKDIMDNNAWGFIAPGLAIIITISLVYLFNVGMHKLGTKRG
ncbi:ABC transporter permease subunit [Orbaceae bacterium ESL0721]|nr:ABC transporter permease subunit [Orbaceae bacterium ESL0721]